jgi:hypothetical protein
MRPDPGDVLSGIERLLLQDIVPALAGSPYLQEQATMAGVLIQHMKNAWPTLHLNAGAEHDDLVATIERVVDRLAGCDDRRLGEWVRAGRAALAGSVFDPRTRRLDEVMAGDRELRRILCELIEKLGDRREGEDPHVVTARHEIDSYLARYAVRESDLVRALGLGW